MKKFTLTDFDEIAKSESLFDAWATAKTRDYTSIANAMKPKSKQRMARICLLLVEMMRHGRLLQHKYIADRVRVHKDEIKSILKFRQPLKYGKIAHFLLTRPLVIRALAKVVKYMIKTASK